ncbi:hypothetical protein AB2S31_14195 [Elizabethkingia anophelis]|uniref:hypothetical protein n=1 Tax=Elizabethkingia anophelis TaxID=1117645 RepID=UPI0005570A4C|nr:hypothetical protein [Elizabethkingia anophelis]MDV3499187.1 hypothetical protein [Elizabethkingia anophelis]MDV3950946.1 hypothetical protein [Elizabethkingia anophelis]
MKVEEKKDYCPPVIEVTIIEMECGIAANSAAISPVTVGGTVDLVPTDWSESDNTVIHTEY